MLNKTIVLFYSCFLSFLPGSLCNIYAQQTSSSESLLGIIGSAKSDSAKVSELINVCRAQCKIAQYTEARRFADAAMLLAQKANYTNGIAEANNQIGIIYWYIKEYDNALSFHLKALNIYQSTLYKAGIAATFTRIGHAYADMPDYDKALDYFTKALQLERELNNPINISNNLNLIGFVHTKRKEYDLALQYYLETYKLVYNNNYERGKAAIHHDIAEVFLHQNKTDEALAYAKKGLEVSLQLGESKMTEEAYNGLEKIYLQKKQYQQAYEARLKYDEILSMLSDADHAGKIRQMEMDYEYDKKLAGDRIKMENEKTITLVKLAAQRKLIYIILAAIIVTVIFSVFIYRSYVKQQKANNLLKETQQQLIESEKMAAIGTVASRMAHEILNPLNFINNFSETSAELMDEITPSLLTKDAKENGALIADNLNKIKEHGQKATAIVRKLETHNRKGTTREFFEDGSL